jgi:hypothetical protein
MDNRRFIADTLDGTPRNSGEAHHHSLSVVSLQQYFHLMPL